MDPCLSLLQDTEKVHLKTLKARVLGGGNCAAGKPDPLGTLF